MTDNSGATLLRQHQAVLLELLKVFDTICLKCGIPYQLYAGTALGAMRHGGFIPWDDDLDVILLRPDYERLMALAPEYIPRGYVLQKSGSEHWPMVFSKLRKDGTTCLENYHPRDPLTHQGVYIDIFPCDNLSDSPLVQRLQYAAARLVIARRLWQRGYHTREPAKLFAMQLSRILPIGALDRFAQMRGRRGSAWVHSFYGGSQKLRRNSYPRAWLTESQRVPFAGGEYPVSAYAGEMLTRLYGDWHALPPEEERRAKQHCVVLDLERPYTDYLRYQQQMKLD